MAEHVFDAIVVGSGFGGAVAALRLAQAGVRTCVIERGRRWERPGVLRPFPSMAGADDRQAWRSKRHPILPNTWRSPTREYPGLLERVQGQGMDVICGAAWGGGSVVYGGMFVRPPAADFDRIFPGVLTSRQIAPFYQRVRDIVAPEHPSALGDQILGAAHYRAARVFDEHARAAELGKYLEEVSTTVDWTIVRRELDGEVPASAIVGEAVMGFNSGAMKSLDKNYLRMAARAREPIVEHTLTMVDAVAVESDGRYRLDCTTLTAKGKVRARPVYRTRHLFMAAGSINTTRLLLAAKDRGGLPRLNQHAGRYWGGNGDYLVLRRQLRERIAVEVASDHIMRFRQGTPTATSLYLPHPQDPVRIMHAPGMDVSARRMWMLGMSIPTSLGRFVAKGRGYTVKWPASGDKAGRTRIRAVTRRLNRASGGTLGTPPGRERTFHPLGGMVLGRACDEIGRVHGHPRLYVVDSALFPGHTACCNPAWTIAAVAERCVARILKEDRIGDR